MKKVIKKIITASIILGIALSMLLFCSLVFKPLGDVVFSICMGSMYRKVGEAILRSPGKHETLSIYKAQNKPFLILGPYRFDEDYYDFFFVNRTQVIRTATDKGGDAWVRIAGRLFLLDDMTHWDRVRMPYWDDMKCDKNSSVRLDDDTDAYIYSFKIDHPEVQVSFAIPAKLFTSDMPDFKP